MVAAGEEVSVVAAEASGEDWEPELLCVMGPPGEWEPGLLQYSPKAGVIATEENRRSSTTLTSLPWPEQAACPLPGFYVNGSGFDDVVTEGPLVNQLTQDY